MSQFFGRFLKGMVEDVVVEKLSNSKTFQKMAVNVVQTTEAAQKAVNDVANNPEARAKVFDTATSFFDALKAEIAKDLSKTASKAGDKGKSGGERLQ